MILENPATVKLLKALVDVGPRGATREHVLKKTGMATTTFYRVLKPLLRRGLVQERGARYVMPLEHHYNFLFKRLHDAEQLENLDRIDQDRVLAVFNHARAHLQDNLLALWLVGSAAHQEMTWESDLDFLAVVKQETDYLPQHSYDVHFIQMTEAEFKDRWNSKDDFVLTAVRHGLLLEDHGFAQDFYSKALPIKLREEEFYREEEDLAPQKEAILRYIQLKARSEALSALSSYAVTIARRMLRVYNVLPAGKPDLFRALHLLFGPRIAQSVQSAIKSGIETEDDWPTEVLARAHQLEDIYQRFSSHLSHLQNLSGLLVEKAQRFEELTAQALKTLIPGETESDPATGGDLLLRRSTHRPYLVECKSLIGACTTAPLSQLKRYVDQIEEDVTPILVVNPYRKLPLLERDNAFSPEVRELAQKLKIHTLTALDLLQSVNRHYLEDAPPDFLVEGELA